MRFINYLTKKIKIIILRESRALRENMATVNEIRKMMHAQNVSIKKRNNREETNENSVCEEYNN